MSKVQEVVIRPLGIPVKLRNGDWGLWSTKAPGIWLSFSKRLIIGLEWKLADLWVGAFIKARDEKTIDTWICLLPCFPIHIIYTKE